MEAIIVLGALFAVCALAARFGHDSREPLLSKEQEFAAYGMTWLDREEGQARPVIRRATRPRRILVTTRRRLGAALVRGGERLQGIQRDATTEIAPASGSLAGG